MNLLTLKFRDPKIEELYTKILFNYPKTYFFIVLYTIAIIYVAFFLLSIIFKIFGEYLFLLLINTLLLIT